MGLVSEAIERLGKTKPRGEAIPKVAVSNIYTSSGLQSGLNELRDMHQAVFDSTVLEEGDKLLVVGKFKKHGTQRTGQIIVSTRAKSISFIGDQGSNQYIKLEGDKLNEKEVVEALAITFLNPQLIDG